MSRAADRLREFHEAFDVRSAPQLEETAEQRRTLHREEAAEVNDALYGLTAETIDEAERRKRLEALAEELADDLVIAYGTADLFGIDLDIAFRLKMDGNMAKLPSCKTCGGDGVAIEPMSEEFVSCWVCKGTGKGNPIRREDGKVLKPEGWEKPSMAEAIR